MTEDNTKSTMEQTVNPAKRGTVAQVPDERDLGEPSDGNFINEATEDVIRCFDSFIESISGDKAKVEMLLTAIIEKGNFAAKCLAISCEYDAKIQGVDLLKDSSASFPYSGSSTVINKEGMTFGEAMEAINSGKKVARPGWNGSGMFLQAQFPDENSKMTFPYLYLTIPDCEEGTRLLPWQPAQVDLFKEDWMIVD